MMYVIFNNQGAIKEKQINEWVVQGSNNANQIGVVIEGTDPTSYAIVGVCKLPNGEVITTTPSVEQAEIKDGVYGVVFSLTEDITALAGTLRINLQAINVNTDKVITSYTVFLCVNEGVDPGEILMMTAQQYRNLLAQIERDVQNDETILTFSTLPEAENYSVGQVIYVHNSSVKKLYECVSNNDSLEWHETFDFNNYYTKAETDDLLNEKQDILTEESLETANLQYAIGFDAQGNLRKGQGGGGGGATYTAGQGIDITNFTISIDDTVVATKTFVSDNYATKSSVESINALIPAQASSTNKLADKDFVNSSIATETATFRGTYNVVTDLELTTDATEQQIASAIATKLSSLGITYDNNDYVYVAFPNATVSTQFDKYDRYKFNGTSWEYEYTLNNSSFTAEQWAAINSGITSGLVSVIPNKADKVANATSGDFAGLDSNGNLTDSGFNADNVFNVINASGMTDSSHFSEEQFNLLKNGKPTRVIGQLGNYKNALIIGANDQTSTWYFNIIGTDGYGQSTYGNISVNTSTRAISYIYSYRIYISSAGVFIQSLQNVNGKSIPAYPTTTTKQYKFVQKVGGNLDYLPDYAQPYATNSTTTLEYETINNISVSADTTYTLATAPTNTYPEYKANITNSGASAINLTFTGVSVIKTNDSNITIASNVLTLPAGTTIECSIVNGRMIAFNWSAN